MFFFVFLCFRCFPRACGQVFPPISPIKWGEIISIYIFLIAYMIIVIRENRGNREKSQEKIYSRGSKGVQPTFRQIRQVDFLA